MNATLLLGSDPRISLPIARSLARHGIPVTVAALGPIEPTLQSKAVNHHARLPAVDNPGFLPALLSLIENDHVDAVMPMSDTALSAIILHYEELSKRSHLCCPAPSVLETVLQKEKTFAYAQACGIPIPPTFLIPDRQTLEQLKRDLPFPLVGKSRSRALNDRGFKVRKFAAFDELAQLFDTEPDTAARCLFQEYCHGDGVGVEVLVHNRQPLIVFQHRRLKELSTGVSVVARSEKVDPQLEQWSLRLLDRIGWEGVAMVEFRQDRATGRSVLMEINGRYWGSISLPLHAGLDIPFREWQLAHGENPAATSAYRPGIHVRWLAGDMMRMLELWQSRKQHRVGNLFREMSHFAWNFRPRVRHMVFAWNDQRQAWIEVVGVSKAVARYYTKMLMSKVLPESFMEGALAARRLDRQAGKMYLKLKFQRVLQPANHRLEKTLSAARTILFICHGNIIRSPMAAALLQRQLISKSKNSIDIESAGIKAPPAAKADDRAIQVADELGISLHFHIPTAVNRELVDRADVIFVMDSISEAMLLTKHPEASRKTFLLGEVAQNHSGMPSEIADPYQGGIEDVRQCGHRLLEVTQTLADRIA